MERWAVYMILAGKKVVGLTRGVSTPMHPDNKAQLRVCFFAP